MDTNEFRALGHDLIEWIAAYREHIGELPLMSRVQPGEVTAQLPAEPPLHGGDLGGIVADLDRIVMPGITHWNHPGFLHYFPSNSDLVVGARRPRLLGARRAGHELADQPGRDRGRGCGHGVAA